MNTLSQNTHSYIQYLWEKELAAKQAQRHPAPMNMEPARQALIQRCKDRKAQLIRGY